MKNLKQNIPQSNRISDAPYSNWVDQFCPLWIQPYLKLSRFDRPIGTWLLLLPCWWGSTLAIWSTSSVPDFKDYWILFGCTLGAILMRGAGCTWNDINDQNFDLKVTRTKMRPIPSGQISTNRALGWMLVQLILSFFILLTFNQLAIIIGIASIIPVAIYPFAKRFTYWPQFFLGICFNWGILVSYAAHNNNLATSAIILYFAGIFWTLFYDTIYAFQDTDDDAVIGVKSTALLFGHTARYWLASFALIILILTNISFTLTTKAHFLSEALMKLGASIFFLHLTWQLWKFDGRNKYLCLKLFQSNKTGGLIVVFFAILAIIADQM